MNRPEEKDIFLQTGCAGEVIRLSEWYDNYNLDNKKEYHWILCMSFYNNMFSGECSIQDNLRHIWNIIVKGTPWKDEVVLELEEARKLRDILTEMIERREKNIAP